MIDLFLSQKAEMPGGVPVEWRDFIISIRDRVLLLEQRAKEFEQVTVEALNSKVEVKTLKPESKPEVVFVSEKPLDPESVSLSCDARNIISKAAKMFGKKS